MSINLANNPETASDSLRSAHHSDDALFSACAAFIDFSVKRKAILDGPDAIHDDDEAETMVAPFEVGMSVMLNAMETLHASTPEGVLARAHCLAEHNGDYVYGFEEGGISGRLLSYLMRDAAALRTNAF